MDLQNHHKQRPTKEAENKPNPKKTKKEEEPKEKLEEEDSLPELRGVLKAKGEGTKKGKKKSVQFGPKFVREVTKITYPWNEVPSDSDSDSDGSEEDDDDSIDSDIAEEIEEELETLISMEKDKELNKKDDTKAVDDEIEVNGVPNSVHRHNIGAVSEKE